MIRLKPNNFLVYGGLFIALVLVTLRFVHLGADPPDMFMDMGESLLSDPYYYTYFARNAVLFDDWHLFDTEAFNIFRNSLISGTAYLVFSIFGVSRITAHFASLLLSLGGITLFFMSVYERKHPALALLVAFFLLSNVMLFFYGRFPLLENGLIFLAGAASFVLFKFGDKSIGAFASGMIIALATFAGKLFGIVLLPAAVLFAVLSNDNWTRAGTIVIGFIVTAIVYLTIVSNGSPATFIEYLSTVSGNIGYPIGLQSLPEFFRAYLSYLPLPGMLGFNSVIVIAAIMSIIFLFVSNSGDKNTSEYKILIFCAIWILAAILIISPNEYRPARYGIFLFMPFSMLAGLLCQQLISRELKFRHRLPVFHWSVLFIALSMLVSCLIALTADVGEMVRRITENIPIIIMLSTVCTIVIFIVRGKTILSSIIIRYSIVIILLAATAAQSAHFMYTGMSNPRYNLRDANVHLSQLVGSNAIITGNYAPALTIDNNIKGVAHFFTGKKYDENLFERFPITHLAIPPTIKSDIEQKYELESSMVPTFTTSIRGATMKVFRLENIENKDYLKSAYDRVVDALFDQEFDTANRLMDSVIVKYPANPSVRLLRLEILISTQEFSSALMEIDELASDNSDNYYLQIMSAVLSARCYHASGDRSAFNRVSLYHGRAKELHPRLMTTVDELFAVTRIR